MTLRPTRRALVTLASAALALVFLGACGGAGGGGGGGGGAGAEPGSAGAANDNEQQPAEGRRGGRQSVQADGPLGERRLEAARRQIERTLAAKGFGNAEVVIGETGESLTIRADAPSTGSASVEEKRDDLVDNVWTTLPLPLQQVVVEARPAPEASFAREQLAERFGARPASLERAGGGRGLRAPSGRLGLILGVLLAGVLGLFVRRRIVRVRERRRRLQRRGLHLPPKIGSEEWLTGKTSAG